MWDDRNTNLAYDPGEPTLGDVHVVLRTYDGQYVDADLTNYQGRYTFEDLTPGFYRVQETVPSGYVSVPGSPEQVIAVVAAGQTSVVNFALIALPTPTSTIIYRVFLPSADRQATPTPTPTLTLTPTATPTWTPTPTSTRAFTPTPTPTRTFTPTITPTPVDPCEPNNSFDQALTCRLESGVTLRAYIYTDEDLSDYYYFDMTASHTIEVRLSQIPANNNYHLYLYNASRVRLGYSGNPGNQDEWIPPGAVYPAGRYYVRIQRVTGHSQTQPYALLAIYH